MTKPRSCDVGKPADLYIVLALCKPLLPTAGHCAKYLSDPDVEHLFDSLNSILGESRQVVQFAVHGHSLRSQNIF